MAVVDNSDIHHGHYEWVACVIFCAVTPAFLLARFYSRLVSKQLGSDDWAALGAWVSAMTDASILVKKLETNLPSSRYSQCHAIFKLSLVSDLESLSTRS